MDPHTTIAKQPLDIRETGAAVNGVRQTSDKRLFCQFLAFEGCAESGVLAQALAVSRIEGVLYEDVNDARGLGLLLMAEDPNIFVTEARRLLQNEPFVSLIQKPELTMFGRTYALGRETDLEDWLLKKPRRKALNPQCPWAVWYPLRRKTEFALLSTEEQGKILM